MKAQKPCSTSKTITRDTKPPVGRSHSVREIFEDLPNAAIAEGMEKPAFVSEKSGSCLTSLGVKSGVQRGRPGSQLGGEQCNLQNMPKRFVRLSECPRGSMTRRENLLTEMPV